MQYKSRIENCGRGHPHNRADDLFYLFIHFHTVPGIQCRVRIVNMVSGIQQEDNQEGTTVVSICKYACPLEITLNFELIHTVPPNRHNPPSHDQLGPDPT